MKKILAILTAVIMMISLAGCGSNAKITVNGQTIFDSSLLQATDYDAELEGSDEEWGDEGLLEDYPSNEFEERVGQYSFESYDEIISLLQPGEAYAYVDIKGADEPILLVTSYTYDNLDGNMAAIDATPYLINPDGKYSAGSVFFTGGTATPIALTDDGCVILGTHETLSKQCIGENGTDYKGIMVMEYIYMNYDEEGNPGTYGGFIRTENTVVDNPGTDIAEDDAEAWAEAWDEYNNSTVVNFTVVE